MKYKSCCSKRCLLGGCEIREEGGCYCACRLVDYIHSLESCIKGQSFHKGCMYIANQSDRDTYFNNLSEERKKEEIHFREITAPILLEKANVILNYTYMNKKDDDKTRI